MIMVKAELEKTPTKITPYELIELSSKNALDIGQHVNRLKELSVRRKFLELSYFLSQNGVSEHDDISDVIDRTKKVTENIYTGENHIKEAYDYAGEVYEEIKDNLSNHTYKGTPTGFRQIDERGGLKPSNLIVLAAKYSQGKTSLANVMAVNAAKYGHEIAFYSLEMTGKELMYRLAAMESGINSLHLINDQLNEVELSEIDKCLGRLADLPIYFDDRSTTNINSILLSIRSLKIKKDIKGVFIDYLQIVGISGKDSREEKLGTAARSLKNLAKELNIWVVLLSQISRDENSEPDADKLRGSGQINEAADIIMTIYRPEYYGKKYKSPFENISSKGTALIDITKGRNIGTFKFIVGYDSSVTKFYELPNPPLAINDGMENNDGNPF